MNTRFGFPLATVVVAALAVGGCASSERSAPVVPPDPTPGSADLSGLGRAQLVDLLGPADFNRIDGPAEIMQYRNGACTLDVFLYKKGADGETRVTHVEARDANMDTVAEDACLQSVVREPRPRSS